MTSRIARWIAWSIVVLYIILAGTGLYLIILTNTTPANVRFPIILFVLVMVVAGIWPAIGAQIVSHHPRHPVGWVLLIAFPISALDMITIGYASYATLNSPDLLPIPGAITLWLNWSGQSFVLVGFTLLYLLFPTGRLLSPRWRTVGWTSVVALPMYLILQTLEPGPIALFPSLDNPYSVGEPIWAVLEPIFIAMIALLLLCNLVSVFSLFQRLRRSEGDERQQVKWLVIPAIVYWLSQLFAFLAGYYPSGIFLVLGIGLIFLSVPAMVVAVAFAIFKYRLYDIDIILNRTLVYGTLTAGVVGLYVVLVGGIGLVFQSNSNLAGAILTTAIVVVLFRPLRTQLQRRVDRLAPVGQTYTGVPPSSMEEPPSQTFDEREETIRKPVREAQAEERIIRLQAWTRPFLRGMWLFWAAIAWGIFILALPAQINTSALVIPADLTAPVPSWAMVAVNIATILAQEATSLISLVLAGVLYLKRPKEGMALFLSYFLLVNSVVSVPLSFLEPFWPGASVFTTYSVIQPAVYGPLLVAFLAVFPNGRFVPPWTRWLVLMAVLYGPVGTFLFTGEAYAESAPILITGVVLWFALILTGLYTQIYRYRHVSISIERQQTKWVLYGFTLAALIAVLWTALTIRFNQQPEGTPLPWWAPLVNLGWNLAYAALPISLTFAVLRYRLYDIDIIINRTLVYGTLTASVVAIYALSVGALGTLFQAQDNLLIALLATGLVAVLFQPLRERLQRRVNRLLYGQRDDPLVALSQLGKRLEAAMTPEVVLPTLVETISQTLKLPYVGISLQSGDGFKMAAQIGEPIEDALRWPLVYQGETIGYLIVGPRRAGEPLSQADRQLLKNIAHQAGPSAYAVQLTQDLRQSRVRLVTAREEERRRLRRDLHDSLGATLAALHLGAGVLRRTIQDDPEKAGAIVDDFQSDIGDTIDEIRRLVYELRPPMLDQLGLAAAVRAHAAACSRPEEVSIDGTEKSRLRVRVETPEEIPPLPAAVEVAAFRIVQEALTNVVHHAEARQCLVRLEFSDALHLEIVDDGVGLTNSHSGKRSRSDGGLGLLTMHERAEELGGTFVVEPAMGGGTRVLATIPLKET